MSENRWSVPSTWCWAPMGEISEIVGGGTPPSNDELNFSDAGLAWITPADLTGYQETYIHHGRRDLSQKGYQSSAARLMPAGTVLFSSRAPIGYCAIASGEISTNQGFKSFVLRGHISPQYVRHYLLGSVDYAESKASGTTFKELSGSRAAELSIPIPPLPEQRRIVAKIDSLTAKSKRARDHLDHIPRLVEKYKQAILAAAFRGELTGTDRSPFDLRPLGELLDDGPQNGIYLPKHRYGTGTPILRIQNFGLNQIDPIETWKKVAIDVEEAKKYALVEGDLVINRVNSPSHLGKSVVISSENAGAVFESNMMRMSLKSGISPAYVQLYLSSDVGRGSLIRNAKWAVNQASINQSDVNNALIPVASSETQSAILYRLRAALAWIDHISAEATSARKLVDKLNQAVLGKALRGELVSQDPNDEPASVLLDRIQTERAAALNARRGRKPRLA